MKKYNNSLYLWGIVLKNEKDKTLWIILKRELQSIPFSTVSENIPKLAKFQV
jgi:hypothetical protein